MCVCVKRPAGGRHEGYKITVVCVYVCMYVCMYTIYLLLSES